MTKTIDRGVPIDGMVLGRRYDVRFDQRFGSVKVRMCFNGLRLWQGELMLAGRLKDESVFMWTVANVGYVAEVET